jgi:cell fate regulator YaaT (PSP1 superfamily)
MQRKTFSIKEDELHEQLRKHLNENDMSGVKIISIEYSLDGRQLFVALNSENSVHYNLKRLHQDVQKMVKGVHLEIRQIGPRDAAKMIQGMGACGMEKRCCSKFLTEFSSISIRMAKTQDISLTPSEITGMCGRLRCCLSYEYDQYVEAIKTLPKRKKRIQTPMGEGRVIQILPLRQTVSVDIPDIGPRQFTREDLDRAEKMARGEEVAPVKTQEQPKEVTMSRPEDQKVERSNQNKQKKSKSRSSRRRRGRRSRKSNNSKKSSGNKNSNNRNKNNNRNKKNNSGRQNNQKKS